MKHSRKCQRGYAFMAKPGRRKPRAGFYRPIKIKPSQLGSIQPPEPRASRLLRASNEFWSIESKWEKRGINWVCVLSQPPMERLVGMNPAQAKVELLRLSCRWSWA